MPFDLLELPWLLPAPDDLRQQIRRLRAEPQGFADQAQRLSRCALDLNALHALGPALQAWLDTPEGQAAAPVTLGILSNGTSDLVRPTLGPSLLRHGVFARIVGTAFGQAAQQALDPQSELNHAGCQFVLLALDHRGLPMTVSPGDREQAQTQVDAGLNHVRGLCAAISKASGATPIVQTLPPIPDSDFGSIDRGLPGTQGWLIEAFNRGLREAHGGWGCLLVDAAALAEQVGLDRWHDPVQWALGKFLMSQRCAPVYADWVARVVAAARGKARKCLVLDLDNTLWGGVIGDDGLQGIVLGQGSAVGEAHLAVQQAAARLRARGVMLAVSSKNDDEVARQPFRSHPDMLLKEADIAVFQANWRDKASNLVAIARALNIGTDALVLLDDNPAERAQVRQALPEVAVPELPDDPAFFTRTLLAAGYFETTNFTTEDRARADQYRANTMRTAVESSATNLDDYLRSLNMVAHFAPFDAVGRPRISQLINKTNQFNLTTRRYSESQVRGFEESAQGLTLQIRLADRFGDNGMISVIICVEDGDDWVIDTWLMSCRVLNRRLEAATLDRICAAARAAGKRRLIGRDLPSGRNGMVAEHYPRLGFNMLALPARELGGESAWALDIASHSPAELPIRVAAA